MSAIHHDAADQPLRPPETESEPSLWRWLIASVLVLVIVVGAYQAYEWLVSDVARRRAAASAPGALAPATPPPEAAQAVEAAPLNPGTGIIQPAAAPAKSAEPPAPAVTGQSIHRCVIGGQVTYSNLPCPEGAEPGNAAESAPPLVAGRSVSVTNDASQQVAACAYLLAEITRLHFEFQQPLPPAVLDHISTRLSLLRAEHGDARCPPLPKALSEAAGSKSGADVVDEKGG